ncbi:UNVERIFIED_CONTAM: Ribosome quality control complex subunit 1 [Sesamum indicum]
MLFRYIHSSYAQAQRAFEAAKAIHDLKGIASILLNHPYHIDSLITLADYFKFTGEHQMSADAIAKCLYAMECAWHPLFAPSPNCQLKYIHDSNKPFFSSLFTHMRNMDRRGCHRSVLEICKFLLSLDSDDPMGAMLSIDYYALRAEKYAWLEQFAEEYREMVIRKAASCHLMKQALMLHPSVLKKLVVKVPLKDRIWTTLLENSFFQSEQTGSPSLDHLIAIYVDRSYIIWRLPDLHKFLSDSALSVIEMLKEKGSHAKDWACGHLLVSDISDSMPTMPPDNLQDFMVDQMGEIENREQFHNIPGNHTPRDLTNRNARAVLFESMLPWINYGTGDGEHIQHDLPEQVNEE